MYVERTRKKQGGKVYEQVLLRESYRVREAGRSRVRKRTLLNLTRFPREQVWAIEWALKHAGTLGEAASSGAFTLREGKSVGAVWAVAQVARRCGVAAALGEGRQGQLALWQVVARVIDQGSRLSAVRLHETHALAEAVGLKRGFDEDDLYENLAWLSECQEGIEDRLFALRRPAEKPKLFLYDVTSSYLEGQCNALGAYGYSRDGKKNKKQIVVGLLCDEGGEPVSVEVFAGNTQDPKTFGSQVHKTAQRFGCQQVTFVGDRGMIKQAQQDELTEAGFYYLTALTKPQIEKLLKKGALQMELFDDRVCEVAVEGRRLLLRRNPLRAEELAAARRDKYAAVAQFTSGQNAYLDEHPRAKPHTALKRVCAKMAALRVAGWVRARVEGRTVRLETDEAARETESRLDGCYVLATDVPAHDAGAETLHSRYKDLARVERGFRTSKTGHLELRPIYVRNENSTRGHVFVVMLAYLLRRELERAWAALDLTVEEGLGALKTLCTMHIRLDAGSELQQIPTPREQSRALLGALGIEMPPFLAQRNVRVATKRKLTSRRSTPRNKTA
jgi:hypothetical protein